LITLHQDPNEAQRAGESGGIAHFGFQLVDPGAMDAAVAEIEQGGGKLVSRGEHAPGVPFVYITDPDGYVIELGNP
jgi:catechol 2,3-dioxygenase-like lactoylglutathione lyase family enzyme